MFLLTILNPFLTREPWTTGFEGVATEICLIQHVQTKTDSMHACKTEYLVMSHGREDSVKSTNVARNRQMSTDPSSSSNAPRGEMELVLPLPPSHRTWSLRALTPRRFDDGPQLISLTVQHTNPGLACSPDKAQIEVPGSGMRIGKRVEPLV